MRIFTPSLRPAIGARRGLPVGRHSISRLAYALQSARGGIGWAWSAATTSVPVLAGLLLVAIALLLFLTLRLK